MSTLRLRTYPQYTFHLTTHPQCHSAYTTQHAIARDTDITSYITSLLLTTTHIFCSLSPHPPRFFHSHFTAPLRELPSVHSHSHHPTAAVHRITHHPHSLLVQFHLSPFIPHPTWYAAFNLALILSRCELSFRVLFSLHKRLAECSPVASASCSRAPSLSTAVVPAAAL